MDRITAAKVFVDVVYSGSFTATADRLDMSRPMVTRYIETMENWLETRLLHRTTRKVTLTSAGEACLPTIENWLEQAGAIESLTIQQEQLSGLIRVATSMSFGFAQLVSAIQPFLEQHKKVSIDLDLEDTVTDLVEQRIDLAIRIASNPDPALIGLPIGVCESVLVAAPTYLAARAKIEQPEQLSQHACLGYNNFQSNIWHLHRGKEFTSVGVSCQLTANEATTLLQASLSGMGISLQPTYLANKYIANGELEQVLPEWHPNSMTIYALYSSRKHLSPAVRALIDHLKSYFSSASWL